MNRTGIGEVAGEVVAQEPQQAWRGVDVLLISVAIVATFLAAFMALHFLALDNNGARFTQTTIFLSAGLALFESVILIGSVYLLGIRRRSLPWTAVGIRPARTRWMLIGLAFGLILTPLSGLITLALQIALGLPVENPQLPFLAPEGFSWFGLVSMFLLGGVIVPFAEELYFRGVLYRWLRQRWGVWLAALASSLVFGAVHGDVPIAGAAFFLGVVLAWVYERSQSLWPAVLIHIINNGIKILALYTFLALGLLE